MLIGAHVSTSGGLVKAYERGMESNSEAIQIMSQSPRAWRPVNWREDDVAEFNSLMADGPIRAVAIHAVYLINCASKDPEIQRKSREALVNAVRLGDRIGAVGVVLHPGSLVGEPREEGLDRVGEAIRFVLSESDSCRLLLENTAGAGQTLGRSFEEIAELIEISGGDPRLGICLDCCHMLASGFDIRTIGGMTEVMDRCVDLVGTERVACLHVNDSAVPLGSNVDRHANLPEGELGREGLAAFLSEPRFEGLPALLEVPGPDKRGPGPGQIALARELREEGLAERKR
jgi:deoxyribonuclease-4